MHDQLVNILTSFLGSPRKHSYTKGQIAFDCPVCSAEKDMLDGDGKGNLEINYYKGVYKCWACYEVNHMSGGIDYLIKKYGSPQNYRDFELISNDLNFDFKVETHNDAVISELPEEFQSLSFKSRNQEYQMAIAYLKERRIGEDIIKKFNLGYCAEGKYAGRIIVPSYDANGYVNYFAGRTYKKWMKPKYLNPDTDKTSIIFNEHKINWDATIYLVEGPFDHLVVPNSIPLLGKVLNYDYLLFDKLYEKANASIIIVLDGDAKEDAKRLYFKLKSIKFGDRVKVVMGLPDELDISKVHEVLGPAGVLHVLKKAERILDCKEIY